MTKPQTTEHRVEDLNPSDEDFYYAYENDYNDEGFDPYDGCYTGDC